jgi:hypothetical protein
MLQSIVFCVVTGIIITNIAELIAMCNIRERFTMTHGITIGVYGIIWSSFWAVFTGLVLGMVGKWPIF